MRRYCLAVVAVAMLIASVATTAYADHSPSFFIQWNPTGGYEGANIGGVPHSGYVEGSQKCQVCHAEHRAPLAGTGWVNQTANSLYGTPARPMGDPAQTANGTAQYPAEAAGTNRATRQVYLVPDGINTQMLLMSNVSGSCDFCHIKTAIGGEQIYAGNAKYHLEANSSAGGSDWEGGYAHNNACTACHAVHGAYNPSTAFAGPGNKIFEGPIGNKILKAYAKTTSTTWQQAVVVAGASLTDTELENLGFIPERVVRDVAPNATVSPRNVPLFASKADALTGTNIRDSVDIANAQVTVFCTFCHENYGYASEDVINPQNVNSTASSVAQQRALSDEARVLGKGLFQGPWVYKSPADGVLYATRDSATLAVLPGLDGQVPVKNHPMKLAEPSFSASGTAFSGRVAWRSSDTCRDCHDAGLYSGIGIIVQSWPHFTPGYFKFLKTADKLGSSMTNIDPDLAATNVVPSGDASALAAIQAVLDDPQVIEDAQATADGACLKCHVNSTGRAGVGISY